MAFFSGASNPSFGGFGSTTTSFGSNQIGGFGAQPMAGNQCTDTPFSAGLPDDAISQ
jgi:hypothetical protein